MLPETFHPVTVEWFGQRFGAATEPQRLGWPAIARGEHTLIAAPTGSGKTLAAFLSCIDRLLQQSIAGELADETQIVYVSPLKALSNDVQRNLQVPLAELEQCARQAGVEAAPIRVTVRTGDTPASERQGMLRRPPHILVTTPESLYLLLTSERGRQLLRPVRTVIVDEIHAVARDKRGSHLALSLERLAALCNAPPVRIGLSATQRPMEDIARFLVGMRNIDEQGNARCQIIDTGHARQLDLGVELPATELSAVCSNEMWDETYARLADLVRAHRSTLIFVNTRRLAERVCHRLSALLGAERVASHHGSLSREIRLNAEQKLKAGELQAIVATASLELGIDIGFIDLVCQISSPRSIATFLQRVGRSGHSLGVIPKGRLFALTRDDLMECLTLIRAVRSGRLDRVVIPQAPLDILAQQIVASAATQEWKEDELFDLARSAWPFRDLSRGDFDAVMEMLSEGLGRGFKRGAYLHRDRINGEVRARRSARLAALSSGGAIPETADYRVVLEDDRTFVGTVNEDFAIESMAGDIFLLGNTSWRIQAVRAGEVIVRDAHAAPATIPFWLGEAPARTHELSGEVSRFRAELGAIIEDPCALEAAQRWIEEESGVTGEPARQAANYVAAQKAAVGFIPTKDRILFERFFDEAGGMQLVIHAPLGARINRAWGLALRKRFCRSFDFELQASADDNGIVLSLGPQHSFPIDQMFRMLRPSNGRHLLEQALLAAPMFGIRWRWNVTRALAVLRQRGSKRVPPQLQRMQSDDLLAAVFPSCAGCFENHEGDMEIPDHPLVRQTVDDCLHEAMDLDRWLALLGDIETGAVELVSADTREPSPFSHQLLNANPYAFLDDAPLEERRARAVQTRRTLSPADFDDLAKLDPDAIAQVRAEAWPLVRDGDELHDVLTALVALPEVEGADWTDWFRELTAAGRAASAVAVDGRRFWIASERWPMIRELFPECRCEPPVNLPAILDQKVEVEVATSALVRGRIEVAGPITAVAIAERFGVRESAVEAALMALEAEGLVLRGRFTRQTPAEVVEWCERRLLSRIHRLTLDGARRQIQPVEQPVFVEFLLEHQHLTGETRLIGKQGVRTIIEQLQGVELPAGVWEQEILPSRVRGYERHWLDELTLAGDAVWGRLLPPKLAADEAPTGRALNRAVPISLALRPDVSWLLPTERVTTPTAARSNGQIAYQMLSEFGALFKDDLLHLTGLLPAHLDEALSELSALGLVTSDSFSSIRALVAPENRGRMRRRVRERSRSARAHYGSHGGRWSRFPGALALPLRAAENSSKSAPPIALGRTASETSPGEVPLSKRDVPDRCERWARQLLKRWGIVFRDLCVREELAPPWRELVAFYRKLELRGEVRGGRFILGVGGEQFALPEALDRLRRLRDSGGKEHVAVVSATDPVNVFGWIDNSSRTPAIRGNALAIRGGKVVASVQAGELRLSEQLKTTDVDRISTLLFQPASVRYRNEFEEPDAAPLAATLLNTH